MRQNVRNTPNVGNRLIGHAVTEKKKTVMAVCLIALMVFMWARVLTRTAPSAAEGAIISDLPEQGSNSKLMSRISYIELPKVVGRHDLITRNFFTSNGWQAFEGKKTNIVSIEEVNLIPGDGNEKAIRKVVEMIKLEAIVIGENAKAFINDKVLSAGDKLSLSDGIDRFECEVVVIEEDAVIIRCREAEVKLKLRQVIENRK